jgi:hypothetical protein
MWKADMSIFTPPSEAVVARAKELAAKAGWNPQGPLHRVPVRSPEELLAEYMLEKGDLEAPAAEAEPEAVDPPAAVVEERPPSSSRKPVLAIRAADPPAAVEPPKEAGAEAEPVTTGDPPAEGGTRRTRRE